MDSGGKTCTRGVRYTRCKLRTCPGFYHEVCRSIGGNGGGFSSPTSAVKDDTFSTPVPTVVAEPDSILSLQTDGRPIGAKRKATTGAIESGHGKLSRAVDSVGRTIEKNGKSRKRMANLTHID
jgi:hypothetical protein